MGFSIHPTTRLNHSSRPETRTCKTRTGELCGSKDTSKGDHNIRADHGRLDSLDDQRGSYELSRPESQHQARRQRTLRDTLRPRSTTRLQRNRRLQNTRTRTAEDAIYRVEGSTPVPKRPKTKNKG